MKVDGLRTTRVVRRQVRTPAEIEESFDSFAYEKGVAVLRMLEAYAGERWFRSAINSYLWRYQYGVANAEDFWTTLADITGRPLDEIAISFLTQPGVPVVETNVRCVGDKTLATLTQQRYAAAAVAASTASEAVASREQSWTIPVCLRLPSSGAPVCKLLDERSVTTRLDGCVPWVHANAAGQGYCRTAYDEASLNALVDNLERLSARERVVVAADLLARIRTGARDVGRFLTAATALANDKAPAVLEVVVAGLEHVEDTWRIAPLSRPTVPGSRTCSVTL